MGEALSFSACVHLCPLHGSLAAISDLTRCSLVVWVDVPSVLWIDLQVREQTGVVYCCGCDVGRWHGAAVLVSLAATDASGHIRGVSSLTSSRKT